MEPSLESRYKDYKWLTKVRARVSRRFVFPNQFLGTTAMTGMEMTQLSITGLLPPKLT